MGFRVYWTPVAELSYFAEIDFIFLKWNSKEVSVFIILIDDFIAKLAQNPHMGRFVKEKDIYSFVVSAQTTLYYKIYSDLQRIDLLLFHNNKRNPKDLLKYI